MNEENNLLSDIQQSVHRIEGRMETMQDRQNRAEARMTDLERDIIEVKAEQRGAEKVMNAEHMLLHSKIDGIANAQASLDKRVIEHFDDEENDRKAIIASQRNLLIKLAILIITSFGTVLAFMIKGHTVL